MDTGLSEVPQGAGERRRKGQAHRYSARVGGVRAAEVWMQPVREVVLSGGFGIGAK